MSLMCSWLPSHNFLLLDKISFSSILARRENKYIWKPRKIETFEFHYSIYSRTIQEVFVLQCLVCTLFLSFFIFVSWLNL
jgi:hypothetical protein